MISKCKFCGNERGFNTLIGKVFVDCGILGKAEIGSNLYVEQDGAYISVFWDTGSKSDNLVEGCIEVNYCPVCGRKLLEGQQEKGRDCAETVQPQPCTNVKVKSVKAFFTKINEELDELKEAVLCELSVNADADMPLENEDISQFETVKKWHNCIAEEAADTITAITSMLEAMGIKEDARQEAQARVNVKNKERGRL